MSFPLPVLKHGHHYPPGANGPMARGGQAQIYRIIGPPSRDSIESSIGFYSNKTGGSVNTDLVVRRVLGMESADKKELLANAREINSCLRFASGYPFVEVIDMYTGLRANSQEELCYVMPLYDMSLWGLVTNMKQPLPELRVRLIMAQLLCSLEHLHQSNLAHRDVTAANILVRSQKHGDQIFLADFGFATNNTTNYHSQQRQDEAAVSPVKGHASPRDDADNGGLSNEGAPPLSSVACEGMTADSLSAPTSTVNRAKKAANDNNDNDDDSEEGGFGAHGSDDEDEEDSNGFEAPESLAAPISEIYLLTNTVGAVPYTDAGTTAWRAPEAMVHCNRLDKTKLDVWAAGIDLIFMIVRNFYNYKDDFFRHFIGELDVQYGRTIVKRSNNHQEQLSLVFCLFAEYDESIWGSLVNTLWPKGIRSGNVTTTANEYFRQWSNKMFPSCNIYENDSRFARDISPECCDVIKAMLTVDPRRRPTASQLLQMPWFTNCAVTCATIDNVHQIIETQKEQQALHAPEREALFGKIPTDDALQRMSENELRSYVRRAAPVVHSTDDDEFVGGAM